MSVIERPLYGRVDLQRYVSTFTQNPAVNMWNPTSGTGFVITTVANGSSATGGTMSGKEFYSSSDGTMRLGRPVMRASYTYTGLTIGRTYTYTSRFASEAVTRVRVFLGAAASEWAEGKGLSTFTTRAVSFTATATSHTLGLEVEAIKDALGVMVAWQTMNLTRNAWAQEQPGGWVTDGLADATNLSFRRGGSRMGTGVKTDVGLMSFTLHNAEDPLNGGTIQPGQVVRAVADTMPDQVVYSYGFEDYATSTTPAEMLLSEGFEGSVVIGEGGWWPWEGAPLEVSTAQAHSGTKSLRLVDLPGTYAGFDFNIDALGVAGDPATISLWVKAPMGVNVSLIVPMDYDQDDPANSPFINEGTGSWMKLSRTGTVWDGTDNWLSFDVTTTTEYTGTAPAEVFIDDVQVLRHGHTVVTNDGLNGWAGEVTSDLARKGTHSLAGLNNTRTFTGLVVGASYVLAWWEWNGSNAWVKKQTPFTATAVNQVLTLPGFLPKDDVTLTRVYPEAPLFTGRVVDVRSTYPLNKSNGKARTSVVVTVSDAVNIHGSTMRYGVQIAEGFETFESRLNRLASTALAPIEAPAQGAPREVYSF